jgi:hypothetical protein
LPHLAIALAADERFEAASRMLAAMRGEAGPGGSSHRRVLGRIAVPAVEASIADRKGEHAQVVALLDPIRDELWRLGASHAQRDIFDQMLARAAAKAGRQDVLATLLPKLTVGRGRAPAERKAYQSWTASA